MKQLKTSCYPGTPSTRPRIGQSIGIAVEVRDEHSAHEVTLTRDLLLPAGLCRPNRNVTAQIYTHRSAGKDRYAATRVACLIYGEDWHAPETPDEDEEAA